ncbi:MAG: ABC transporter permease [Methylobacter tundripaludum]|nr:ABC transporter permease [Methylobacter tundripaludum]
MFYFNRRISRGLYLSIAGISFLLVLVAWSLLSQEMESADIFLPTPWSVADGIYDLFLNQAFFSDILASLWRVSIGFALSVCIAIPLGILIGTSKYIEAFLQPLNDFTRYLPVAALIPLTIIWVGIGDEQKILIIFLGTVFQLVPMVADTVARTPQAFIELGYTLGYSKLNIITKVVMPWSLPQLYDHARVALGWAWSYLIVAELVAASEGIGHVIIQAQRFIQINYVMAGIVVIGIIGLFFDFAFRLPKPFLFPWIR